MKIENRKPRPSRFGNESPEARLTRLRESAPTLVPGKKLRIYALFGSVLLCLTIAAFYFAMQIYQVVTGDRVQASLIEVDQMPEIERSETQKVLEKIEQQQALQEAEFEKQMQALQEIDLLQEMEQPGS